MRISHALFTLTLAAGLTTLAHADDPISGTVWTVPAGTANHVPTPGSVPGAGATEVATFNASAINFSEDGNGSPTLGLFLNSEGAASNINYINGGSASTSLVDVLFEFTGSAVFTNGQTFTVHHDDGVELYVNGSSVLDAPDTTSPVDTPFTYTGPTGTFNFDFVYANGPCCDADFTTTLVTATTVVPSNVPEPSSLLLLGTGALTFAGAVRRRFV